MNKIRPFPEIKYSIFGVVGGVGGVQTGENNTAESSAFTKTRKICPCQKDCLLWPKIWLKTIQSILASVKQKVLILSHILWFDRCDYPLSALDKVYPNVLVY